MEEIHQLKYGELTWIYRYSPTRWWFQITAPTRCVRQDRWFQILFYFHPYLGKWSNLTNIFQMGWNHQLFTDFYQVSSMFSVVIWDFWTINTMTTQAWLGSTSRQGELSADGIDVQEVKLETCKTRCRQVQYLKGNKTFFCLCIVDYCIYIYIYSRPF